MFRARQLAAIGVNLILVSRRAAALDALGAALQAEFGIACRSIVQDLAEPGAGLRLVAAAHDCEVGLYISNAGADGFASFFEDSTDAAHRLVRMNITTLIDAANGFGKHMLARGKGGIIVMASGAGTGRGNPTWCCIRNESFRNQFRGIAVGRIS